MSNLFTREFWQSIAWALVRTVLAGIVPFIPALMANPADLAVWLRAGSTIAVLAIFMVATSLKGVADPESASWWQVLISRFLRQFGQFMAAGLTSAVVLSDVDWQVLLTGAAASAITTLVMAALTLIPDSVATVKVQVPEITINNQYPADGAPAAEQIDA